MVTVHKGRLIVESVQNQGFCSLQKLQRKSLWCVEGGVETTCYIYLVVSMVGNLHYLMGVVSTSTPGWIKAVSTKFFVVEFVYMQLSFTTRCPLQKSCLTN